MGVEDDVRCVIGAIGKGLAQRCREDDQVREAVGRLARWLLEAAAEAIAPAERAAEEKSAGPAAPARPAAPLEPVTLSVGDSSAVVRVAPAPPGAAASPGQRAIEEHPVARPPTAPAARPSEIESSSPYARPAPDLPLIVRRARLKEQAARWAGERRRRIAAGLDFDADVAPTDRELISAAKALPNCYLWMLDPYGPGVPDDDLLEQVGGCHLNLAEAVQLVDDLRRYIAEDEGDASIPLEDAVRLLAEAQSALRVMLEGIGMTRRADQDQFEAFLWLKEFTSAEGVYVDRHMRLADPADPTQWRDLARRIDALRRGVGERRTSERHRRALFNKARYHFGRISSAAASGNGGPDPDDWVKALAAVDGLVRSGLPASAVELREALLPHIDAIPEGVEVGDGAGLAIDEVERYREWRDAERREAPAPREPSADVRRAAELLRGQGMVIIGGLERPQARAAIERGLELASVRWISSRPHQTVSSFEPDIARADTHIVVLAIRWSSHSFESVKSMCERYGKAFVRLPGGYNVNQLARHILLQASGQLVRP